MSNYLWFLHPFLSQIISVYGNKRTKINFPENSSFDKLNCNELQTKQCYNCSVRALHMNLDEHLKLYCVRRHNSLTGNSDVIIEYFNDFPVMNFERAGSCD